VSLRKEKAIWTGGVEKREEGDKSGTKGKKADERRKDRRQFSGPASAAIVTF
jgi:hypothetical protein